jgi:hypothetical protein
MILRRVRFEGLINKGDGPDSCWIFTGAKDRKGYGMFWWQGKKTMRAHRAAHLIYKGPIGEGLEISHVCKRKLCVRPDHLAAVTPGEHAAYDSYRRLAARIPKREEPFRREVRELIEAILRLKGRSGEDLAERTHHHVQRLLGRVRKGEKTCWEVLRDLIRALKQAQHEEAA